MVPPMLLTLHSSYEVVYHRQCKIDYHQVFERVQKHGSDRLVRNYSSRGCSWWDHGGTIICSYSPWLTDESSKKCSSLHGDQCSLIVSRWYHHGATRRHESQSAIDGELWRVTNGWQLKASCGTTNVPLTAICDDWLTIGSPLMAIFGDQKADWLLITWRSL